MTNINHGGSRKRSAVTNDDLVRIYQTGAGVTATAAIFNTSRSRVKTALAIAAIAIRAPGRRNADGHTAPPPCIVTVNKLLDAGHSIEQVIKLLHTNRYRIERIIERRLKEAAPPAAAEVLHATRLRVINDMLSEGATLAEIGRQLSISGERVRQIIFDTRIDRQHQLNARNQNPLDRKRKTADALGQAKQDRAVARLVREQAIIMSYEMGNNARTAAAAGGLRHAESIYRVLQRHNTPLRHPVASTHRAQVSGIR